MDKDRILIVSSLKNSFIYEIQTGLTIATAQPFTRRGFSCLSNFNNNIYVIGIFSNMMSITSIFGHKDLKGASLNYVGKILPIFDPLPLRRQVYYISLCSKIGIW